MNASSTFDFPELFEFISDSASEQLTDFVVYFSSVVVPTVVASLASPSTFESAGVATAHFERSTDCCEGNLTDEDSVALDPSMLEVN